MSARMSSHLLLAAHQWWANSCSTHFLASQKEWTFKILWIYLKQVTKFSWVLSTFSWFSPSHSTILQKFQTAKEKQTFLTFHHLPPSFPTTETLHLAWNFTFWPRIFHSEYLWSTKMWSRDVNRQFLQLVGFAEALPWDGGWFFVGLRRRRKTDVSATYGCFQK